MNRRDFEKFKRNYGLKILVQETQFEQWLRFFFFINQALNKKYDSVYQDAFYIKLYELLTEGVSYSQTNIQNLSSGINEEKLNWYNELLKGLKEIRSSVSNEEFDFIQYKRHSASHIFQDKYEVDIKKNGKLKTDYKPGISLEDITLKFQKIILQHGSDKNFDVYITGKLYPKINALYQTLISYNSA